MSQVTDKIIANQAASSARSDLNAVLDALDTMNSGSSTPSTPQVGMLWYDTTNGPTANEIKIYDGAGFITLCYVDATNNEITYVTDAVRQVTSSAVEVRDNTGTKLLEMIEASSAQALAGTSQYVMMTPRRTNTAIAALTGWVFQESIALSSGTYTTTATFEAGYAYRIIGRGLRVSGGSARYMHAAFQKTSDSSWVGGSGSSTGANNFTTSTLASTDYCDCDITIFAPLTSADEFTVSVNGSENQFATTGGSSDTMPAQGTDIHRLMTFATSSADTIKAIRLQSSSGGFTTGAETVRLYRQRMTQS